MNLDKYWHLLTCLAASIFFGSLSFYSSFQLIKAQEKLWNAGQKITQFKTDQQTKKLDDLIETTKYESKKIKKITNFLEQNPKFVLNLKLNTITYNNNLNKIEEKRFRNEINNLEKKYGTSFIVSKLTDERFKLHPEFRPKKRKINTNKNNKKKNKTGNRYDSFLNEQSVKECIAYWAVNHDSLHNKAQKFELKNPTSIAHLISLIRHETNLGRYLGEYKVFNSLLSTVTFGKKTWVRNYASINLDCLFEEPIILNPFDPSSSAGAGGITQGMPKALNEHAKDGDNDGEINVFTLADATAFTLDYFGAKEGNKGIKNLAPYIKWYNPHDKDYEPAIKRLAEILNNNYDLVLELKEKIDGPLLTKEKEFKEILERKYFKSLDKENKRLWNFQYIIEYELDSLEIAY